MAEVVWTEPALGQLDAIIEFIALDKAGAATRVAQRIFSATDHLESFVRLGRSIPEFPHKDYRQVWLKPCWLYYRIDDETPIILHVRRAEQLFRLEELFIDD